MMVDFPEPDEPTSAVTVPGCEINDTSCSTGFPGSYSKTTFRNSALPAMERYLCASGAASDLRKAIWTYNRADWYVAEVLAPEGDAGCGGGDADDQEHDC